ncbi:MULTISPECIES: hypothetical protein [unclassified Pseudomonas]|uniref:hypothetical protein n=1 Tax=unclassified Pseudomonas TaxID=196821 RepID=UPI00131C47B7|nr:MULTISPECIES: hypothetical protein [unclassified Pseudomonas]
MRFHGCASAISDRLPLIGVVSKKIKDLFDEIDLADFYWSVDTVELLSFIENRVAEFKANTDNAYGCVKSFEPIL